MKKSLIILSLLLLTGCSNELVCTLKTSEEGYESEQKITFEFDDSDKVTDVYVNYSMIFEDEETAKSYVNVFEALEKDYKINQDGNKIDIVTTKNYEQYKENKDELKEELENNGYSCK